MTAEIVARDVRLPTDRTIAFAISIVASKPEELSIREYIALLRQHIAPDRREHALSSSHNHLDRSAYWRSQYERSNNARRKAEYEATGLKLEIAKLKEQLTEQIPDGAAGKKRKKADGNDVLVPRSPKRPKPSAAVMTRAAGSAEMIAEFDFTGMGAACDTLMRSFYQVNCILTTSQKTNTPVLAQNCVQAASAVVQVIRQIVLNGRTSDDPKTIFRASSRAVLSLTMGLNRLSHVQDGVAVQGHVIYAYVRMFAHLVDIASESVQSTVLASDNAVRPETATRKRGKSKMASKQAAQVSDPGTHPARDMLATFVFDIVAQLDSKNEAHKALFEGYTYVVLEKLGSHLYTLVFGIPRAATIEGEISTVHGEDVDRDGNKSEDGQAKAARLEASFLLQLMKRIVAIAPEYLGTIMSTKPAMSKKAGVRDGVKGALASTALKRLQQTLIKCAFGAEESHGAEGLQDCLKMPVMVDAPLAIPEVNEADGREWFIREMWRLLGWQILGQEEQLV
ncbi:hypothetical protein BDY17DRAFT_71640 [Neohortaea acidophila]|uniref:Uncharacterized protein n=1 Tax=Neohortaea acidophila TaxID=245834 RepID=A0A6A6Q1K6_9PEZI|nr:uncharacterized protein BDY17DRAFT_71640 [Neohortaea acidophila]KAF2486145.1 hypothetical protein BDY17DRAFT_71640 [Neohortaea acidophila]